jgi:hypothetical protein
MKIAFIHNVHNRYKTLLETITIEKELYPDSDIYIMYNLKSIDLNIFSGITNIYFYYYSDTTHKLGCANGCILGFKNATKKKYDVIIFSHDDVMVNKEYSNILNDNIKKIISGEFNAICRKPDNIYGGDYIMMETFMINGDYAKKIFSNFSIIINESDLPVDNRGSLSPEVLLSRILGNDKINKISYHHQIDNYNITLGETMGYYHKNIGLRGWKD